MQLSLNLFCFVLVYDTNTNARKEFCTYYLNWISNELTISGFTRQADFCKIWKYSRPHGIEKKRTNQIYGLRLQTRYEIEFLFSACCSIFQLDLFNVSSEFSSFPTTKQHSPHDQCRLGNRYFCISLTHFSFERFRPALKSVTPIFDDPSLRVQ